MDGVANVVPVPNEPPPLLAAYQLRVPAEAVAPKLTLPVPQPEFGVVPVMVGMVFTVATTSVLEAVVQPLSVASTQ